MIVLLYFSFTSFTDVLQRSHNLRQELLVQGLSFTMAVYEKPKNLFVSQSRSNIQFKEILIGNKITVTV